MKRKFLPGFMLGAALFVAAPPLQPAAAAQEPPGPQAEAPPPVPPARQSASAPRALPEKIIVAPGSRQPCGGRIRRKSSFPQAPASR
jgi:hypothetical protein